MDILIKLKLYLSCLYIKTERPFYKDKEINSVESEPKWKPVGISRTAGKTKKKKKKKKKKKTVKKSVKVFVFSHF